MASDTAPPIAAATRSGPSERTGCPSGAGPPGARPPELKLDSGPTPGTVAVGSAGFGGKGAIGGVGRSLIRKSDIELSGSDRAALGVGDCLYGPFAGAV